MINRFAEKGIHALEKASASATGSTGKKIKVSLTQKADEFVGHGAKTVEKKAKELGEALSERISEYFPQLKRFQKPVGEVEHTAASKTARKEGEHILKDAEISVEKGTDKSAQKAIEAENCPGEKFKISGEKLLAEDEKLAICGREDLLRLKQMERLDLHIPAEELNELFKLEGDEFILKACDLLCKKLNVPKELYPAVLRDPSLQKDTNMMFCFSLNQVRIRPDVLSGASKDDLMCFLRHELQHHQQWLNVLRCETSGQKAVEFFAQERSKMANAELDTNLKNLDSEQLKQIYGERLEQYLTGLQNLLKSGKTEEYEQALENDEKVSLPIILNRFENIRKTVVDSLGTIKANTPESRRAEKCFDYVITGGTPRKQNGNIDQFNYYLQYAENEAYNAQRAMFFNIEEAKGHKIEDKIQYINDAIISAQKAQQEQLPQNEFTKVCEKISTFIEPQECIKKCRSKEGLNELLQILRENLSESEFKLFEEYICSVGEIANKNSASLKEEVAELVSKETGIDADTLEFNVNKLELNENREEYIKKLMYLYL